MGDLRSQLAACRLGERRFCELLERYGAGHGAEMRSTRSMPKRRPSAGRRSRRFRMASTRRKAVDAGRGTPPYDIKVKVTVAGSDMEIDLSGCSPQRENAGLNSRTYAGAYIAYKAITAPMNR